VCEEDSERGRHLGESGPAEPDSVREGLDGVESEPCHDDGTEPAATIRDRRADRQPGTALPDRARLDVWNGSRSGGRGGSPRATQGLKGRCRPSSVLPRSRADRRQRRGRTGRGWRWPRTRGSRRGPGRRALPSRDWRNRPRPRGAESASGQLVGATWGSDHAPTRDPGRGARIARSLPGSRCPEGIAPSRR
jgi:hypothetical protein